MGRRWSAVFMLDFFFSRRKKPEKKRAPENADATVVRHPRARGYCTNDVSDDSARWAT